MFEIDTATDYADLLERLDTFLTTKGSAFGLAYSGTGDGTLTGYSGGASSVAETFTITATSPTSFDVVGSVTGSIGPATVGTPFAHATLEFLITAGATPFVAGDEFTLTTAPKWTNLHRARGCRLSATQINAGSYGVQNLVDGKPDVQANAFPWDQESADYALRGWQNVGTVILPQDVEIEFFEAETIGSYELTAYDGTHQNPDDWELQYWNGSAWVTLDAQSAVVFEKGEKKVFTVVSPVSATKYRWHITGLHFTQLRMHRLRMFRQSDGVDACLGLYAWKAPGNDGDSEIYSAAKLFERIPEDYFNWEIFSFDAWNAGVSIYQQAGVQGQKILPLWDAAIPYWFICDGRRAIVIAKISTSYEVAVFGWGEPYYSPNQWPIPALLGAPIALGEFATWEDAAYRWSLADNRHRAPTHADVGDAPVVVGERKPWDSQLALRNVDGNWKALEGTVSDAVSSKPAVDDHLIWPTRCGFNQVDPGADGSYDFWPVMLMLGDVGGGHNTPIQLPGVAIVTGQGLTVETLLRRGAVDWIVIPNVTRTGVDDFLAVGLD